MRTGIDLESKVLSVNNTFGIPTTNRSYVMGMQCSPDEGDTGLKTPCEVLVGLPARDLHCNRKHARTYCFVFSFFWSRGLERSLLHVRETGP